MALNKKQSCLHFKSKHGQKTIQKSKTQCQLRKQLYLISVAFVVTLPGDTTKVYVDLHQNSELPTSFVYTQTLS